MAQVDFYVLDRVDEHARNTLACKLAEHGRSLQPGDRVITGAFAKFALEPGSYEGDFGAAIGWVTLVVVA